MKCFALALSVVALSFVCFRGTTEAGVLISRPGPDSLDGASVVALPNESIGLEGSVSFDFQTANPTGDGQRPWNMNDAADSVGEMGVVVGGLDGAVKVTIWNNNGGYVFSPTYVTVGSISDTAYHHIDFTWKEGSPTLCAFDGAVTSIANTHSLIAFTSGYNSLGGQVTDTNPGHLFFTGTVKDFVMTDVYTPPVSTPEPGTMMALLSAGLFGLLCYAWRKRK
jgi:hypothetical protein